MQEQMAEHRGYERAESNWAFRNKALLTAQKMLKESRFTLEDISNFFGLPLDEIKKLQMK